MDAATPAAGPRRRPVRVTVASYPLYAFAVIGPGTSLVLPASRPYFRKPAVPVAYGLQVQIEVLREVTDEVVTALARLLPQLSQSAGPLDREALRRVVTAETNTVLAAVSDGRIVGTLTLVTVPALTGVRARIEDVVVDEDARGQGVGAALTQAALERARAAGAESVELTSRPSRVAANHMYQRLGFQRRETNLYRYPLT